MKEQDPCVTCKHKVSNIVKVGSDIFEVTDVCKKGIDIGGMGFPSECSLYSEKNITLVLKDLADSVQNIKID